jgi:hypothetical protein
LRLASKCKGCASQSVGCELSSALLRIGPVGCKVLLEEEGTSNSRNLPFGGGGFQGEWPPQKVGTRPFSLGASLCSGNLSSFVLFGVANRPETPRAMSL